MSLAENADVATPKDVLIRPLSPSSLSVSWACCSSPRRPSVRTSSSAILPFPYSLTLPPPLTLSTIPLPSIVSHLICSPLLLSLQINFSVLFTPDVSLPFPSKWSRLPASCSDSADFRLDSLPSGHDYTVCVLNGRQMETLGAGETGPVGALLGQAQGTQCDSLWLGKGGTNQHRRDGPIPPIKTLFCRQRAISPPPMMTTLCLNDVSVVVAIQKLNQSRRQSGRRNIGAESASVGGRRKRRDSVEPDSDWNPMEDVWVRVEKSGDKAQRKAQ